MSSAIQGDNDNSHDNPEEMNIEIVLRTESSNGNNNDQENQIELVDNKKEDIIRKPEELKSPIMNEAEKKISNFEAFIYLSKLSLGTGLLAYPLVVQQCGVIPFVIIGLVICIWVNFMTFRMNEVYYKVRESMNDGDSPYPSVSRIILGKYGEKIFMAVFVISIAGVACVYSVTGAELIGLLRWDKIGAPFLYKNTRFILIPFYILLLPFMFLSNLSFLSFTNVLGLSIIGICVVLLIIYGLVTNEFAIKSINWYHLSAEGFAKGVGTLIYTFPFGQNSLTCVSHMKSPQDYQKISFITSSALFVLYILFGVVEASSFLKTEEGIKGNILTSINSESVYYYIITILIFIICILSIPNIMVVVFDIIDRKHTIDSYFVKDLPTILMRTAVLVCIIIISVAIPNFDILVSLMGNVVISSVSFILPGALHYVLFKDSTKFSKITNLLSVFLGSVLLIYTTVQTIIDIAK